MTTKKLRISLESERLMLRNLHPNDLEEFHAYRSNPEVTKYQGFDVYSKEEAQQFILSQKDKTFGEPGEWLQLAAVNKNTGKLIGDCALKLEEDDPRIAQIGCTISPTHQKNGYAKEIMLTLMRFLFEENNVHRISEITDELNISSVKLLESLEFRREGHFKENIWFKGRWGSEYIYAMLKSEWTKTHR
jgi:RimJ/RimL family protein N-acetyltransferase